MGCDGGVIATKRKFFRGAKTGEKEAKSVRNAQITRIRACAQSGLPLNEPIVACELGNLFNKDSIIEALLYKTLNSSFSHIRGLKDLKELILTPNPSFDESLETNGDFQAKFICPVTMTEFNGFQPFVVIWSTGHVLSEKALREMGVEGLQPEYGPFNQDDVVKLLPLPEDLPTQQLHMNERRSRSKKTKESRKRHIPIESAAIEIPMTLQTTTTSVISSDQNSELLDDLDVTTHPKVLMKKQRTSEENQKDMTATLTSETALTSALPRVTSAPVSQKAVSTSSSKGLTVASSTVQTVQKSLKKREEESSVFKSLFHKGLEADKKDRDLFINVSGLRYTIS